MTDPVLARIDTHLERSNQFMVELRVEMRRSAEIAIGIRDVQREMILDLREMREEMRASREESRLYREEARKEALAHHQALQQTNESMALMLDELRSWGDRRRD